MNADEIKDVDVTTMTKPELLKISEDMVATLAKKEPERAIKLINTVPNVDVDDAIARVTAKRAELNAQKGTATAIATAKTGKKSTDGVVLTGTGWRH